MDYLEMERERRESYIVLNKKMSRAKVRAPLTALPSFIINGLNLSYYDNYDEVMDLLMDLNKNSRAYWRTEHRDILKQELHFKMFERVDYPRLVPELPGKKITDVQKRARQQNEQLCTSFCWPLPYEFKAKCLVKGKQEPVKPVGFKFQMGHYLEDIRMVMPDRFTSRAFGYETSAGTKLFYKVQTIVGRVNRKVTKV